MAAVFEPQMAQAAPTGFQAPRAQVAVACGLLYDAATHRTFRIPDVPATSTVAHIKQWYSKNVNEADPRSLAVIHNAQAVEDSTQVWQLAQGQGQFAVTVAQAESPRSMLSLYVATALPIPPLPLSISSDSTVLYVKQRVLEMLNLPMSMASAGSTTLVFPPSALLLQNDLTLEQCAVPNNAHLTLAFQESPSPTNNFQQQQQPPPQLSPPTTTTPFGSQPQYNRIKEIWADAPPTSSNHRAPAPPMVQIRSTSAPGHALLPSLLFEEDDEEALLSGYMASAPMATQPRFQNQIPNQMQRNSNPAVIQPTKGRGGRRQRSRSPEGQSELSADQRQHLAENFRTKMCRSGASCKFGRNCWFAHHSEELRKPSDPLPNNLPAVHKLERYSHREANNKDRN